MIDSAKRPNYIDAQNGRDEMERKVFKFELEPTAEQEQKLNSFAGARRFVYNWGFARCRQYYKETGKAISWKQLSEEFTALKNQEGFQWLKEIDSQALQQALADLRSAFINFFEKRARYPRFKRRKDSRQSFRIPQRVKVEDGRVYVPKIGRIKIRQSKPVDCPTKSATFKRDACGNWFVCLVGEFELPEREPPKVGLEDVAGLDVGLSSFLTLSDESEIANPRFYRKAARKLRRAQRKLSRRQKGSRNRAKAKVEVAHVHQEIANKRNHFIHTLSFSLISNFLALSFESLNVGGLAKHLNLSPSPKIDFASGNAFDSSIAKQRIQSIFCDAELLDQLRTAFTFCVSRTYLFSLLRGQLAAFLRRQLNIRVSPAFVTVQFAPQQFQEIATLQAMLLSKFCWIQELAKQSVRRKQAAGLVCSSNRHTMFGSGFRRLKLPPSCPTNLSFCVGRELDALIGSCCRANIEQPYAGCSSFGKKFLFQAVAGISIGYRRASLKNKSIRAVFVPSRLKMWVAMSAFTQLASVLMKPLLNILALPDVNRVVCCTSNGVNAAFHSSIITHSTKLAKSVLDAAWGMFFRACEYKGRWCNRHVVFVGRFFPSTKRCSECGYINEALTLSDREWDCPVCGSHHHRDLNASKNLQLEGFRLLVAAGHAETRNACGADVRLAMASSPR